MANALLFGLTILQMTELLIGSWMQLACRVLGISVLSGHQKMWALVLEDPSTDHTTFLVTQSPLASLALVPSSVQSSSQGFWEGGLLNNYSLWNLKGSIKYRELFQSFAFRKYGATYINVMVYICLCLFRGIYSTIAWPHHKMAHYLEATITHFICFCNFLKE